MKAEVAVLGSPSLISLMVSVDLKHRWTGTGESQLRSCVKEEVDVLGFPSLCGRKVTLKQKEMSSKVRWVSPAWSGVRSGGCVRVSDVRFLPSTTSPQKKMHFKRVTC